MNQNLMASMKEFHAAGGFDRNPSGVYGRTWFVDTINGARGNNGRSAGLGGAFALMSTALANTQLRSGDEIVLFGVCREQCVAPLGKYDITIRGGANRTRQATNSGVPTGGGSTWMAPASGAAAATPLLELREQGWTIDNIDFVPPADDAAVKLHCEETATYPDASHATFRRCRFTDGLIGIEDYGGASNVLVEDCTFESLAGAGGGAIVVTNQGIRIPQRWTIRNNRILPCVNGLVGAWVDSVIRDNTIAKSTTATMNLASGNTGLRNFVVFNYFNIAAADFDPAGGVTGNATDTWINYLADTLEFGIPAN